MGYGILEIQRTSQKAPSLLYKIKIVFSPQSVLYYVLRFAEINN